MKRKTVMAPTGAEYLSDVVHELPSKCLFDKGVTGCGGTTLEIRSQRDSVILVPTVNLVLNKTYAYPNLIGVHGDVTRDEFMTKCRRPHAWLKIIATYDSLPKLEDWMGNALYKCFLLVDEYHILFNSYAFRHEAVSYVLRRYKKFERYCFMTATPLDECNTLEELKDLPQVCVRWPRAVKVKAVVEDVWFTSKKLLDYINTALTEDWNLHVFLNSINTIRSVVKVIPTDDYRTICSKNAKQTDLKLGGKLHVQSINSPVRKVNFYTATAFEGVDIYDPVGRTVVVSDSHVAQSLMDISTLFIQICGRLRNSKYKDDIVFIINTGCHRYLKHPNEGAFLQQSDDLKRKAQRYEEEFTKSGDAVREVSLGVYEQSIEYFKSRYLSRYDDAIRFDPNLQRLDKQNYRVVHKFFQNSLTVINAINSTGKAVASEGPLPLYRELHRILGDNMELLYQDIIRKAEGIFSKYGCVSNADISKVLGKCATKRTGTIDGKRRIVYNFLKLKNMLQTA